MTMILELELGNGCALLDNAPCRYEGEMINTPLIGERVVLTCDDNIRHVFEVQGFKYDFEKHLYKLYLTEKR